MAIQRLKKNLAPGTRITVRDQEWIVRSCVLETEIDARVVTCEGVSGITRNVVMTFIDGQDRIDIVDPLDIEFALDTTPKHRESRLWIDTWARKVVPTDNTLVIGHRGVADKLDFQHVPAAMALDTTHSVRPRILIADAVGLGKTIEVGILLSELIKRGKARRILVVVLKSMMTQFQKELWSRFAIALEAMDRARIEQISREIPRSMNPLDQRDRVIISMDTLKHKNQLSMLENSHWDVIVIDECHNVARRSNSGTQRSRLAQILSKSSESLILTSATPHDGTTASYASLLELLDPLLVVDPTKITKENMTPVTIQRYAKDVRGTDYKPSKETEHKVEVDTPTQHTLKKLSGKVFQVLGEKANRKKDIFFRTTLAKALMSSPEACASTLAKRLTNLEKAGATSLASAADEAREDHKFLKALQKNLDALSLKTSPKFKKLLEILAVVPRRSRVVIFSEYILTQEHLAKALAEELDLRLQSDFKVFDKAAQVTVFNGAQPEQAQQEILESFQAKDSKMKIMIATDVASEGVNLHYHCAHLIHFDIPWSLITICQRNGRIDRYGQSETPQIHYLIAAASDPTAVKLSEARVVEVLIDRARQAKEQMGNVGIALGVYDPVKEEEVVAQVYQDEDSDFGGIFSSTVPEISQTITPDVDTRLANPWRPYRVDAANHGDLAFIKEAAAYLGARPEAPSMQSVTFEGDAESLCMQSQIRALAPVMKELGLKHDSSITYTDRPEKMQEAIVEARKKTGLWPECSYAWEVNPAIEALGALVEAKFPKDRTQVLMVTSRGVKGFLGFIVYRALYDDSGHPIFSKMEYARPSGKSWSFTDPKQAFAELGWSPASNNPGVAISKAEIKELHILAKGLYEDIKARSNMEAKSAINKRDSEVDTERKRAMQWYTGRKKYLQEAFSRPNQRRKMENELKHLDDLRDRHRDFIDRYARVETSNLYVRIVAAFMGAG